MADLDLAPLFVQLKPMLHLLLSFFLHLLSIDAETLTPVVTLTPPACNTQVPDLIAQQWLEEIGRVLNPGGTILLQASLAATENKL